MPTRMSLAAIAALFALALPLPVIAGTPSTGPSSTARAASPKPKQARPAERSSDAATRPAGSARATPATATARVTKDRVTKDDGYSYTFGDDPLQGAGYDAAGARIAVRSGHVRGLLIRPRIQFVDAMLKSVENL